MNQSMAIPVKVLMKSLHLTASEPPTSIICVWNVVRCASGSSIPVNVTLGPVNVLGITVSRIGCENGLVNSLGGVKCSGSSTSRVLCGCATRGATPRSCDRAPHFSPETPRDPPACALVQPSTLPLLLAISASYP